MATVKQVLEQVDAMLPNQYTTAEKRRWLLQAEGFVVREVHQPHAGGEETEVPPERRRCCGSTVRVAGASGRIPI